MSGVVLNANPTTNCLLVFINVAGNWYSKPSCATQVTAINPNGTWSLNIAPVPSDVNATQIAVFLVPTNYSPSCVNGLPGLTIPPQAEADVYTNRVPPTARRLNFSNYSWSVKTSSGNLAGPGPNYFSDSTNNVWVDASGYLHLKITTNSGWQCAEIISDRNFGYGQYRFTVSAPINLLDANAVLGLFTYSYDSVYNEREIDIEFSRWEYDFGPSNVADYAIAPYNPGQTFRFPLPAGVTNSTHSFTWQPNNVAFQSLNGSFASPPAASNILETWNITNGIPPAGGEQVHLNLWLDNGNPPALGLPVEAVITQFEFVPLGPPPRAQLNKLNGLPKGPVQLSAQATMDWRYQIFSSSNLLNWLPLGTVIASNNSFSFTDTNPVSPGPRFYRAQTLP